MIADPTFQLEIRNCKSRISSCRAVQALQRAALTACRPVVHCRVGVWSGAHISKILYCVVQFAIGFGGFYLGKTLAGLRFESGTWDF